MLPFSVCSLTFYVTFAVSTSMSVLVTLSCPVQRPNCEKCLLQPFFSFHSLQRLMNWLCGCCQCVCAPGEGVLVTDGNPSYGIHPGVTIVADLQGALGACWPREQLRLTYCCHTLGDTAVLLLRAPLIGSDKMTFSGELRVCRETSPDARTQKWVEVYLPTCLTCPLSLP